MIVRMLLAMDGIDFNRGSSSDGWTPLLWAASYGYKEIVEMLLAMDGIDLNPVDEDGLTPLLWAAKMRPGFNLQGYQS
jgi:ankyrin repeat protein